MRNSSYACLQVQEQSVRQPSLSVAAEVVEASTLEAPAADCEQMKLRTMLQMQAAEDLAIDACWEMLVAERWEMRHVC